MSVDAGPVGECSWFPVRDGSGPPGAPARVAFAGAFPVLDAQAVSYEGGFFFVVSEAADKTQDGEIDWVSRSVAPRPGSPTESLAGLSQLAGGSQEYAFLVDCELHRPELARRAQAVPDGSCTALVNGANHGFIWGSGDGSSFPRLHDVELTSSGEELIRAHRIEARFPLSVGGAIWDPTQEQARFLTGEIRDAIGEVRLWSLAPGASTLASVVVDLGDGFTFVHELALWPASGQVATIDMADLPTLRVFDIRDGAPVLEIPSDIDFFLASGRPSDANLAAHPAGILANLNGVVVDFRLGATTAALVFDEAATHPPGSSTRGFDIAVRGNQAVTVTGFVAADDGVGFGIIAHFYECR